MGPDWAKRAGCVGGKISVRGWRGMHGAQLNRFKQFQNNDWLDRGECDGCGRFLLEHTSGCYRAIRCH